MSTEEHVLLEEVSRCSLYFKRCPTSIGNVAKSQKTHLKSMNYNCCPISTHTYTFLYRKTRPKISNSSDTWLFEELHLNGGFHSHRGTPQFSSSVQGVQGTAPPPWQDLWDGGWAIFSPPKKQRYRTDPSRKWYFIPCFFVLVGPYTRLTSTWYIYMQVSTKGGYLQIGHL